LYTALVGKLVVEALEALVDGFSDQRVGVWVPIMMLV